MTFVQPGIFELFVANAIHAGELPAIFLFQELFSLIEESLFDHGFTPFINPFIEFFPGVWMPIISGSNTLSPFTAV